MAMHRGNVRNHTAAVKSGSRPPRPAYLLDDAVRAEHAGADGRWRHARHHFAQHAVKEVANRRAPRTVVLTVTDSSFNSTFDHWLRSVEVVSGLVPAVAAPLARRGL